MVAVLCGVIDAGTSCAGGMESRTVDTKPQQDNPSVWQFGRDGVALIASTATVVAGLLYGYGWLILAQFYGRFGVSPEDVGVTFAFVTVRIAIIIGVISAVVAPTILILKSLSKIKIARQLPLTNISNSSEFPPKGWGWIWYLGATWGGAFVTLVVISAILQSFFGLDPDNESINTIVGGIFIMAPLWIGIVLWTWLAISERMAGRTFSLRQAARIATVVIMLGSVGILVFAAWWLPRSMADTVQQEKDLAYVHFLDYIGLRAESVEVTAVGGSSISPRLNSGSCVRLLGSSGGVTILYDPQQRLLVRAPAQNLIIEKPCR
jgi:hypothetical protein